MTPLVFLNGVLLGTFASISFGLTVVMLIFALLGTSEPQVSAEWPALIKYTLLSLALTVGFAFSFIGHVRQRLWRWRAQGASLAALVTVVVYSLVGG
ncbi:MAG: hypothetical protein AAF610_15370 [Pseudomonadota bacterium]